jgi:hypothetical protein
MHAAFCTGSGGRGVGVRTQLVNGLSTLYVLCLVRVGLHLAHLHSGTVADPYSGHDGRDITS